MQKNAKTKIKTSKDIPLALMLHFLYIKKASGWHKNALK
jgi:hypothetical protein